MDRRLVGALLVVAVVAAATVAPALNGLRIAGQAIAIELPADPQVGDCVFEPSGDDANIAGQLVVATSSSRLDTEPHSSIQATSVVLGPCGSQPVVGEVVAVASTDGDGHVRRTRMRDLGLNCRSSALQYAGLSFVDNRYVLSDQLATDPVSWDFSMNLLNSLLLPSPPLQAVGRTWAACIAAPARQSPYYGRIALAYNGGRLPDEFGTCWDTREPGVSAHSVDCGAPHLSELISIGAVPDRAATTASTIRRSCEQLAAGVMGRADPTASGALAVQVAPETGDTARWLLNSLNIVCYVVPTQRSLNGSLVGLGDRPVPLSN